MRNKTLIVALLVLPVAEPRAQTNAAVISTAEIIADISEFKRYVLLDTAKIDFCGLHEAFDANGIFRQPANVAPPRYSTVGQCRATENQRHGPVILNARALGDTVIVSGFTKRGTFGFIEEFRYTRNEFSRSPQTRWRRLYTITAITES